MKRARVVTNGSTFWIELKGWFGIWWEYSQTTCPEGSSYTVHFDERQYAVIRAKELIATETRKIIWEGKPDED